MIQTENPTQSAVRTPAEATGRNTERVGKNWLNMASIGCVGAHFSRLTSTVRSLADSRGGVQRSIGRDQDVRHLLGELHVPQAIVDCCLAVGIPQQAKLGAAASLVPET